MDISSTAEREFRRLQELALAESGFAAQSGYIDIQSPPVRLHVLEGGSGDPVVMISGNAPAILWAPLAARMAGESHLLMPDRPGTGLSTSFNFRGVDLRSHGVEFLTSLLDALGLQKASLVGNSMGGYFAMAFAVAHPDRVGKLALLGEPANAEGSRKRIRFHRLLGTRGINTLLQSTVIRPPRDAATARQGLNRSKIVAHPDRVSDSLLEAYAAATRLPGVQRSFRTMVEQVFVPPGTGVFAIGSVATHALVPELGELTAPTLFLWGEKDPLGSPDVGRMLVEKMPRARLVEVEDAGHVPWLDQPDFCAEAVVDFLRESTGTETSPLRSTG